MNRKEAWQRFLHMPPEMQRQVIRLIALLQKSCGSSPGKAGNRTKLAEETFVGTWRDRRDLANSSEWVRKVRRREWAKNSD